MANSGQMCQITLQPLEWDFHYGLHEGFFRIPTWCQQSIQNYIYFTLFVFSGEYSGFKVQFLTWVALFWCYFTILSWDEEWQEQWNCLWLSVYWTTRINIAIYVVQDLFFGEKKKKPTKLPASVNATSWNQRQPSCSVSFCWFFWAQDLSSAYKLPLHPVLHTYLYVYVYVYAYTYTFIHTIYIYIYTSIFFNRL